MNENDIQVMFKKQTTDGFKDVTTQRDAIFQLYEDMYNMNWKHDIRRKRASDTVKAEMRELVAFTFGALGVGNVIVARRIEQKDLLGIGIYHHEDVYITS